MAQVTSRFTPEQVLEAGQRAEVDGRTDYAVQFYRHLTDYHPGTQEAAEAAHALQRLAGHGAMPSDAPIQLSTVLRRPHPAGPHAAPMAPAAPAATWTGEADPERLPSVVANSAGRPANLPPPVRGYRIGRSIAVAFSVIGWLLIAIGVAAIGLGMVVGVDTAPFTGYSGIVTGPAMIGVGVAVVFWAQLANAVFATANATRDLAAIERAKAERGRRDS